MLEVNIEGLVKKIHMNRLTGFLRRRDMRILISSLFILVILSVEGYAQVASSSVEKPKWGEKITVTYNPQAEGAIFSIEDDVMVLALFRNEDYSERYIPSRMTRDGGVFKCDLSIEEQSGWMAAYFITQDNWDRNNTLHSMLYNREGKPARNAYQNMMFSKNPIQTTEALQWIAEELKAYPDNYAAYLNKWMFRGTWDEKGNIVPSKENMTETVKSDLARMASEVKGEPLEYLHAQFFGSFFLKDEKQLRALLFKIAEQFPQAPLTAKCIEEYRKWLLIRQVSNEDADKITALEKKIAFDNPSGEFARRWLRRFSGDLALKDPGFELIAKIARQMTVDEEGDPLGHYYLGTALLKQKADAKAALESLDKAIVGFLKGNHRLYGDVTGRVGSILISSAFRTRAQVLIEQDRPGEALSDAYLAKQFQSEASPVNLDLIAKIWETLDRTDKAEEAYIEAIRSGSKTAESSLKAIYARKHGQETGFKEYLASRMSSSPTETKTEGPAGSQAIKIGPGGQPVRLGGAPSINPNSGSAKSAAPHFKVTALDGKTYDLADLRGKVVVLNFWFIGCAPCQIEIPSLNKLVQEFKGKDVVFLAFALDGKNEIEGFLKKKPFDYQIIPAARAIADAYGAQGFPTHIIIDREGRIQHRMGGGSDNINERLHPLIKYLLPQQ